MSRIAKLFSPIRHVLRCWNKLFSPQSQPRDRSSDESLERGNREIDALAPIRSYENPREMYLA